MWECGRWGCGGRGSSCVAVQCTTHVPWIYRRQQVSSLPERVSSAWVADLGDRLSSGYHDCPYDLVQGPKSCLRCPWLSRGRCPHWLGHWVPRLQNQESRLRHTAQDQVQVLRPLEHPALKEDGFISFNGGEDVVADRCCGVRRILHPHEASPHSDCSLATPPAQPTPSPPQAHPFTS